MIASPRLPLRFAVGRHDRVCFDGCPQSRHVAVDGQEVLLPFFLYFSGVFFVRVDDLFLAFVFAN